MLVYSEHPYLILEDIRQAFQSDSHEFTNR